MKIAVHVHLFYINMYEEIRDYLNNLEENNFDIFYTLSVYNAKLEKKIINDYSKHKVKFLITKNIGFDVYPFLCFLNTINLNDYDLIFKLHSKKDIPIAYSLNGYNLSGNAFRDYLFTSILGTKQRVQTILNTFSSQPEVGMIGAAELIIRDEAIEADIDITKVINVINDCKETLVKKEFIAGTIFVARSCLFHSLKARGYKEQDFPSYYPRDWNSLPYCLERYFGFMVSSQGYKLIGLPTTGFQLKSLRYGFIKNISKIKSLPKKILLRGIIIVTTKKFRTKVKGLLKIN